VPLRGRCAHKRQIEDSPWKWPQARFDKVRIQSSVCIVFDKARSPQGAPTFTLRKLARDRGRAFQSTLEPAGEGFQGQDKGLAHSGVNHGFVGRAALLFTTRHAAVGMVEERHLEFSIHICDRLDFPQHRRGPMKARGRGLIAAAYRMMADRMGMQRASNVPPCTWRQRRQVDGRNYGAAIKRAPAGIATLLWARGPGDTIRRGRSTLEAPEKGNPGFALDLPCRPWGLRKTIGGSMLACPSCGRTLFNLEEVACTWCVTPPSHLTGLISP